MKDSRASTVPERAPAEVRPEGEVERALVGAIDEFDPIERGLTRARAEAGLFGDSAALRIGRYRIIERVGSGGMGVVWSAYDPELARGVALKLASTGDASARARVLDEGRALAKLSHPNVVPIYDVLDVREGVFLVMELVKGRTLREFATSATVPEVIRAYRQAGEGLAAAHHAGLIHRDFKADNAILGGDARVRVLDFGLAHEVADAGLPTIGGTPRYMAPEQKAGLALTPAVDQYGLCVALEEALRSRGAIPKWLAPIVARGAAVRAEDRYASMPELLRALAFSPAAKWRQRALIAGVTLATVAIVAAFALGRTRRATPPCESGPSLITSSWGPEARQRAVAHLTALDGGYAPEAMGRIVGALDGYSAQWVDVERTSCLAHQAGSLSVAMFDRRNACLDRRKSALTTIGELSTTVGAPEVAGLVVAAGSLPELAVCGHDDALLSPVAPPPSASSARAAVIADRIARVDIERDAGRTAEATRDAEGAVAAARALAYEPLVARALVARGRITLSLGGEDRGAADFTEATQLALGVGDDALAIEAYARAAYALATTSDRSAATEGLPLIEAITRNTGDRAAFARALLHHNLGGVALARGDRLAARRAFEQARQEARGLQSSAAVELTAVLMNLMIVVDDPAERDRIGAELVAQRNTTLGPNHPLTLKAEIIRASLGSDPRRVGPALTPACTAMANLHPEERASIRECTYELAWRALVDGDLATAAAMAARVIAAEDPESSDSRVIRARAFALLAHGDAKAAELALSAIPPLQPEAPWWQQLTSIDVALGLALAHGALHEDAARAKDLDRAELLCHQLVAAAPIDVANRLDAVATLRR